MSPYVIQDLTSYQQVIFIHKREVAKHQYVILEINHCPATGAWMNFCFKPMRFWLDSECMNESFHVYIQQLTATGLQFLLIYHKQIQLQTDWLSHCCFIAFLMHQSCFEDSNRVRVLADLVPALEAAILEAMKFQLNCTWLQSFWSYRGLQPAFSLDLTVALQHSYIDFM